MALDLVCSRIGYNAGQNGSECGGAGGTPTGGAFRVAGYDTNGELDEVPGFTFTAAGYLSDLITVEPDNDNGSIQAHSFTVNVEPLQASPNDSINLMNLSINLDNASGGFGYGTNGTAARVINAFVNHDGTADVGEIQLVATNFELGNGTDPFDSKGFALMMGFGQIAAGVNITNSCQGYGFQPTFNASATVDQANSYVQAFYDATSATGTTFGSYTSVNLGPQLGGIANNRNYVGINLNPTISELNGNANFTGLGVYTTINSTSGTGSWNGVQINPQNVDTRNAYGVWVSMDNATVYAGVQASVTIQDLFFEAIEPGEGGNSFTITYTGGGTAGSEVVTNSGADISVQIQSGVSTATQVKAALDAYITFASNATVTITGTGSNPQTTQGPTSLAGGEDPGQNKAGYFDGDVEITGDLTFGGDLSIQRLNAVGPFTLSNVGGQPQTCHFLISSITGTGTVANADTLGVNTAALINLDAGATITTAFTGVAALGLPAVLTMGAGSTIDSVSGALFALSLGGGSGTADTVSLCKSLAIPDGTSTVNRLYGYEFALPFGDPGTDTWGLYISPDSPSWLKGSLRLGGTAGSDDTPDTGFKFHVEGDSKLEGDLAHLTGDVGFFGTTPVSQQTGGAATAGGAYTATEQAMLQAAYDALRAYGLLS